MTDAVQIVAVAVSVALLLVVIELVRRRKLTEEYSVIWICCAGALLALSVWRRGLDLAALALGVHYPPALLLLAVTFFVIVVSLYFSLVVSRQRQQIERLIEEVALLDADVRELRKSTRGPSAEPVSPPRGGHSTNARRMLLVALSMLCSLAACEASPAGFWTKYRSTLIVGNADDQGPWGGSRWVQWQAPAPGAFTASDAIRFAASQGWTCEEPVHYSADQLRLWQFAGKPVFPLHFSAADRAPTDQAVARFPRNIDGDSLIVRCDSGWTRVEPGPGSTTKAYGYIHVDKTGTRLAVYHLWGEI